MCFVEKPSKKHETVRKISFEQNFERILITKEIVIRELNTENSRVIVKC